MPELPEVESARATIERAALDRRIADVDDADTWECRPHPPGEIRAALLGRSLTGAFRRGKSMWCETSGVDGASTPGPVLGLHLGMSGRILVTGPDGSLTEGGDWLGGRYGQGGEQADRKAVWDRFTITFADGGTLRLFDKRRLGRVRLDPDTSALGPDAELVDAAELGSRLRRGRSPGQARLSPRRPVDQLSEAELDRLHHALHTATKAAIANGGVHTGEVIAFRGAGRHCPRCGTEMVQATVGGRTTWWCPQEQR